MKKVHLYRKMALATLLFLATILFLHQCSSLKSSKKKNSKEIEYIDNDRRHS